MQGNKIILTPKQKKALASSINIITDNFKIILQKIQHDLFYMIDENNYNLNPDGFQKIIEEETVVFLDFLKTKDIQAAALQGKKAAVKGIDKNIISSIYKVMQTFFRKYITKNNLNLFYFVLDMIIIYKDTYQDSFTRQFIKQKNKEQEGLFKAQSRIIIKQQKEMLQKEKQFQQSKFKALEEQNQQRLDFLINFAHETKLPLSIILNTINVVKDEAGRRKLQSLPALENEIKELMNMVIDILDNEKIIQGKMLFNHNIILNIAIAVKSKIELFKGITAEKDIQVISEIEQDLYIRISPYALDRILNNIMDNAIKYNAPKGGKIHITLKGNGDSVILVIRDKGIGIPADQLSHIFEPYYQCAQKKRNIQGIGAGLPLVKSILNEISAKIMIESKLQKGTTVTIKFKKEIIKDDTKDIIIEKVKLTKPVSKRSITLKPENYDTNKRTILVVEDNVKLLSFMQNHMDGIFNYYYTRDGQEALRKLKTMPKPDVIISDIMMDIMDGYEFFQRLREIEEMQDIPFIFLTAKTTVEEKIKGLRAGAVDYIEKPFDIQILKEKIKSLINDHEVYKEKETERMGKKILKVLRTKESNQVNYDQLCFKYKLTTREQEVVQLVIKELDNKDIAEKLFISQDAVRKHIQRIRKKCGVKKRYQIMKLFQY